MSRRELRKTLRTYATKAFCAAAKASQHSRKTTFRMRRSPFVSTPTAQLPFNTMLSEILQRAHARRIEALCARIDCAFPAFVAPDVVAVTPLPAVPRGAVG